MELYESIKQVYAAVVAGVRGKARPASSELENKVEAVPSQQPVDVQSVTQEAAPQRDYDAEFRALFPEIDQDNFTAALREKYADVIERKREEYRRFTGLPLDETEMEVAVVNVLFVEGIKRAGEIANKTGKPYWIVKPARPTDYCPDFLTF